MTEPFIDPVSPRSLALCRRAEVLIEKMERVESTDGAVLFETAEERGWVAAIRFFAPTGTLTEEGLADAEESVTTTEKWVDEHLAAQEDSPWPPLPLPPGAI
ncbi:MAG: hypothetical protein K2X82_30935 [Gemmataceae bacterium]|nr:hypothetical protein [Gemmataceae bacterium]